jgi:hypothetical protein
VVYHWRADGAPSPDEFLVYLNRTVSNIDKPWSLRPGVKPVALIYRQGSRDPGPPWPQPWRAIGSITRGGATWHFLLMDAQNSP